jgi:glycosyltransferase involved in cell wall biosynthesis
MPNKILIVSECFYPEEFKVNDIALAWKDKGYDVDVLTLIPTYPIGNVFSGYKNRFLIKDEYLGIKIFRLYAVSGYRDSKFKKILKYLNFMVLGSVVSIFIGRKYDYVFGFNLGPLTDMLPAVLIKKLYKKPVMFWVQDIWPDSVYAYGFKKTKLLAILLDGFVKFMFNNISVIAITSKGFKNKIEPYLAKNLHFVYAPNWADELHMQAETIVLSEAQKVHFTFAGNVGKVQNLENIIAAFSRLTDRYQTDSQLNIIGDGSNLTYLKEISNNNPNIKFFGNQLRKEMSKFYQASDFLIVSLIDKEVFSVTVPAKTQTYISAQKPILAIINGAVSDIVNENNLGISVNPSDIELITKAFIKCIDMPESEKNQYTVNNQKLIESIFNKENIINDITRELISSKSI